MNARQLNILLSSRCGQAKQVDELTTTSAAQLGLLVPAVLSCTYVKSFQFQFLMLQPGATNIFGFVEFRERFCLRKDGTHI